MVIMISTHIVRVGLLGLIGIFCCIFFTYLAYTTEIRSIRQHESHILKQISIILSEEIETKLNQQFVSTYLGEIRGNTTREQFYRISDPLLHISKDPTSIGWIPRVEARDRDMFVEYANTQFPEQVYHITTFDYETRSTLPLPHSNDTIWPILFSNPITAKFTGFDIYGPWADYIETLIETRDIVLIDLIALENFGGIGDFLIDGVSTFDEEKEPYIYMILQPVFDYITDGILGVSMEVIFPQGMINRILRNVNLDSIDDFSLTIFRHTTTGIETVYDSIVTLRDPLDDFTDIAMSRGGNSYTLNFVSSNENFVLMMSSDTRPEFKTYGAELIGGFFIVFISLFFYSRQSIASTKYQAMAKSYKKSTDMKSIFLAEMSHELRTPLNGIIGTIEMLTSMDLTQTMGEYVNDIKECSIILLKNISEILDFSKIEAGKLTFNIEEPIMIGSFIHGIIRIMSQSYSRNTNGCVKLILALGKDFPNCLFIGDTGKLRQILMNLVSNAFKFTDKGYITVKVSCEFIDFMDGIYLDTPEYNVDNLQHVAIDISVSDTGIGMSDEKQAHIFEAFSQVHTGRSSIGGTGLGLVITKSICDSMGGEVSCVSKKGQGTTFHTRIIFGIRRGDIPLPGSVSHRQDQCTEWTLISDSGEYTSTLDTSQINDDQRILIVDDISINRKVLERILNSIGIQTESACDGASAIEMCRHTRYCMILMDYYMPGMTGPDATRIIRTNSMNNKTIIVGITASLHQDLFDDMLDSGMDEYIQKPVQTHMIEQICKKYVSS